MVVGASIMTEEHHVIFHVSQTTILVLQDSLLRRGGGRRERGGGKKGEKGGETKEKVRVRNHRELDKKQWRDLDSQTSILATVEHTYTS